MAQLAIRGHAKRGKEVIEILEMLGGKNIYKLDGEEDFWYILSNSTIKYTTYLFQTRGYRLNEFLEKFPYKVGDKVFLYDNITEGCVNGMKWDEKKRTVKYCVYTSAEYWCDVKELLKWNKFDSVEKHYRDNVGEKDKNLEEVQSDHDKSIFIMEHSMWPIVKDGFLEYEIVDGYEFDKIENGNIILKQIKPKYPKNYKECCDVLGICPNGDIVYAGNWIYGGEYLEKHIEKIRNFQKLLICRDAYWKLCGEEMGLGKPWEPDWADMSYIKYCIEIEFNLIRKNIRNHICYILSFPTKEMRDAFKENFKNLIEECKEFL